MDFELDTDQLLLQETLQRLLARDYTFERRREIVKSPWGFSEEFWRSLAEQGVLGVGLPEDHGGFGGPVEVMVVMEQIGRSLVLEPFLSTVVLGGGLVRDVGTPEQQSDILPAIVSGDCRMALAHHEPGARYSLDHVRTIARRRGDGFELHGRKTIVLDGAVANLLVVSAWDEAANGLSLFLLDPGTPGVERVRYRTHDGRSAADLKLEGVVVPAQRLLGPPGEGLTLLERAVDQAVAALCAEAVGAMEALNETTLEYLKSRRQFGQPIGRFQALQHRMADMYVMATQARSMSLLATGRCTDPDAVTRRRAVSAAKAFVGKAARFVGQQAVQLHGGMGISAELSVGHYFKRLTMIEMTFGDTSHHVAVVGDAIAAEAH